MSVMTSATEERWNRVFAVVPFPLLLVATVVALATGPATGSIEPAGRLVAQLVLVAATAAWMWWWTIARPDRRRDLARMRVHYAGRSLLALALTLLNPLFCIFAWIGFVDAHDYFRRRQLAWALAATALIMAIGQSGGLPPEQGWHLLLLAGLFVVNLTLAWLFGGYGQRLWESNEERAVTIAELEQVNAELERALAENVALHRTVLAQARDVGVQQERQRLAREIHDTLAQSLAGIVAQLEAAVGGERQERALCLAREALGEARRSVLDLAPTALEGTSLAAALGSVVRDWAADRPDDRPDDGPDDGPDDPPAGRGVRAELVVTGEPLPLHPEVEATVLRIAQESLTNVDKHAAATRVGVTLSYDGDEVVLDVRDDGVGFDVTAPAGTDSFGLRGMRQRAERLTGALTVESRPGGGTAVSVRLPALAREAA